MKTMFWKKHKNIFLFVILFFESVYGAQFATIKSNKVNVRVGPGVNYPIVFVFLKQGEPVEIISRYDSWCQVRDIDKEGGWVHVSLLSNRRSVIANGEASIPLFKLPYASSRLLAYVDPKVRCKFLDYCYHEWCYINCQSITGWLQRQYLWGIADQEFFDSGKLKLYAKIFRSIW